MTANFAAQKGLLICVPKGILNLKRIEQAGQVINLIIQLYSGLKQKQIHKNHFLY